MLKTFILSTLVLCFVCQTKLCHVYALGVVQELYQVIQRDTFDGFVGGLKNVSKVVPSVLQKCQIPFLYRSIYNQIVTENCIEITANLIKLEYDKVSKSNLYVYQNLKNQQKKKFKDNCPIVYNFLFDTLSGCMQSLYDDSVLIQKIIQSVKLGRYNNSLDLIQQQIDSIPVSLDNCGLSQAAIIFQKQLPDQCVKSMNQFAKSLIQWTIKYSHIEWAQKHIGQLIKQYKQIKTTCPFLQ